MMLEEESIQVGPEQRRGEQLARFGMPGGRGRRMTPTELAAFNLNKALENYHEFTEEERYALQAEFEGMASLRTMNLDSLAATLAFMKANRPTLFNFQDKIILPYILRLIPSGINEEEKRRLIIRFKAQILRYIRAVELHRSAQAM